MMIERCVVVFFPMHSKALVNARFTVILLCICILPHLVWMVPIMWIDLGVKVNKRTIVGKVCTFSFSQPFVIYFFWASLFIIYILHLVTIPILVVVLSAKLLAHRRHRSHLIMAREKSKGEQKAKANSALVIMFLLSSINFIFYLPYFILSFFALVVDTSSWSKDALYTLSDIGRFSAEILSVCHSINFLVYFCRVPSFRTELVKLFSCCFS